jgi:hypothetical protein
MKDFKDDFTWCNVSERKIVSQDIKVVKEWIKLLQVDGKDTKQIVIKKLQEWIK